MNRNISGFFFPVFLLLFVAACYASVWISPAAAAGGTFATGLGACLVIVACCLLLFLVYRPVLPGASGIAPVVYAVLAAAHPAALYFSPFHIAVLLMALCLYCYLLFNTIRPSHEMLFLMWAAFSAAGIFVPSLFWLLPVLLFSSLEKAPGKGRFLATAVWALALPLLVWTGIRFLVWDTPPTAFLPGIWDGMTTLHLPTFNLPAVTVVRITLTAAITLAAILRIVSRMSVFRTAEYQACWRLILMTLCLTALSVLFLSDAATPAGMLVMLPVAPLLGRYFQPDLRRKLTRLMLIILALLLVAERISLFVKL